MTTEHRIILIDDGSNKAQELKVVLDFMGESAQIVSADNWQQYAVQHEALAAIILIDSLPRDRLSSIAHEITEWNDNVPLLLYGEEIHQEVLNQEIKHLLIGYITEPLRHADIMELLYRCQISKEHQNVRGKPAHPSMIARSMIGKSSAIEHVHHMLEKVAGSDASVLILGQSGTGKEVAARTIHQHSPRSDKPFVPVNCGAIPAELLESELFGHEKGSFTGAISSRKGRFELAEGGTLFLDEIGDMPLPMQVKLLRVLQERCFERVGSNKSIEADVRIIAATHRNLDEEIKKGNFREDLFYRLNVFPVELPTLQERIEDLPLILEELIARTDCDAKIKFLPKSLHALMNYDWPGNIRELANLVERMTILYPGGMIDINDLPKKFLSISKIIASPDSSEDILNISDIDDAKVPLGSVPYLPEDGFDLKEHLVALERHLIEQALSETNGVVSKAADFLKMRRTTLVEKMRKYGMQKSAGAE